jgi:hypothetical protein
MAELGVGDGLPRRRSDEDHGAGRVATAYAGRRSAGHSEDRDGEQPAGSGLDLEKTEQGLLEAFAAGATRIADAYRIFRSSKSDAAP